MPGKMEARVNLLVVALSGRGAFLDPASRAEKARVNLLVVALSGVLAVPCTGNPP